MLDKIIQHADTVTKLVFALMAAFAFGAIVVGSFLGVSVSPEAYELTKAIIYVSVGIGVGTSTRAAAARASGTQ